MADGAAGDALRREDEAAGSNTLGVLLERVRRYWLLVLAVIWLAVLGAVYATKTAPTTYVGRTSLIVSSDNRSPDQDAVLVQGYVVYFNDSAYQEQLSRGAGISPDVSLSAEAVAASPILVVSATATDPATVQSDAIKAAEAFRDDINSTHTRNTAQELAALQDQLDTALGSGNASSQAVVSSLQDRISQVRADQVNVLQELQAQGGVSAHGPSLLGNLVPAVAGGLLIGVLAALLLASTSRRLHTGVDVRDKTGLPTLVELSHQRNRAGRARQEQRLGQLANITRARLAGCRVVAVTQPEDGLAASFVARELAAEWARQGHPTVLVTTGGEVEAPDAGTAERRADPGRQLASVLGGAGERFPQVRPSNVPRLSLLEVTLRSADDAAFPSVSELSEFLEREALAGQYVVMDAPAVVRSAAAQAICHGADQTILVIDTKVTRVHAAREAVRVLRQMGASVMGAVVATVDADQLEDEDRTPGRGASEAVDAQPGRPAPASPARALPNQRRPEDAAELRTDGLEGVGRSPADGAASAGPGRNTDRGTE